ncbi:hypothetical protein FB107DRAFT_289976 [Schizophyllum commune]
MAGGVHSSVLLAARGSVSGVDPSPKLRGAAADEAQSMHARTARVVSRHLPSTCRLGAQASCTPDEPEPALTSARGSMIAGSLERADKMPARTEEQLLFGSGRDAIARVPGTSGRVAHCSHRHVEPVLLDSPRWLLTLQRTAPKVRGPPGLRGLPGSTSRQFCARELAEYSRRAVANSVPIPTVCGRPGKPLVLFANRAGA